MEQVLELGSSITAVVVFLLVLSGLIGGLVLLLNAFYTIINSNVDDEDDFEETDRD